VTEAQGDRVHRVFAGLNLGFDRLTADRPQADILRESTACAPARPDAVQSQLCTGRPRFGGVVSRLRLDSSVKELLEVVVLMATGVSEEAPLDRVESSLWPT